METAWMLLMLCTVVSAEGVYTTRIITEPSQGPFRIGQQVQFSCLVEPMPRGPVTYQWRMVERVSGSKSSAQNFSRTFYERYFHYCYYYCEILLNGTVVDSASRIIEVQGYLYTEESTVRNFSRGENLMLNVNISDYAQYIRSIAWYHNGSEIASGNRYSIENNATRLFISNMVESDAGTYQVKINSICPSHHNGSNAPDCDSLVLPLLESSAAHAPVTFTVQEQHVPVYNPASIVTTYYLADSRDENGIELSSASLTSSPLLESISSYWYWNGTLISSGGQEGLSLAYNNTATVLGDYVEILWTHYFELDTLRFICEDYIRRIYRSRYSRIPIQVSFWSVELTKPPSSVSVDFESPILSGVETTTVECTAVGGEPEGAFNLTLWRNGELLAHTNGSHLSHDHMTTPYQYGTYRCSVGSVHNTSILQEKVYFQLQFDAMTTQCEQNLVVDLKDAIVDVLRNLCQSCHDVYRSNIGAELNCSASGKLAYITAWLTYSTLDGRVTASTLVTRLHAWLLSQEAPHLLIAGTPVALRKDCPLSVPTGSTCCSITSDNTPSNRSPGKSTPFVLGIFTAGVIAGAVVTALFGALIICALKLRGFQLHPKPADGTNLSVDVPMSDNQAYTPLDMGCQACESMEGEEALYELPDM